MVAYPLEVLTELMVQYGVGHVLEGHSPVPQEAAFRVVFRVVPGTESGDNGSKT